MSVRTVFCDFCCRQADMREMFMCPRCRKTICRTCAEAPPFPPDSCIRKREKCPVADSIPPGKPPGILARLFRKRP